MCVSRLDLTHVANGGRGGMIEFLHPQVSLPKFWGETSQRVKKCNVCEMLYANKLHLFIVFGEHDGHIGNINHLW